MHLSNYSTMNVFVDAEVIAVHLDNILQVIIIVKIVIPHVLLVMVLEIIIVYHAILDSSYYTELVLIIVLLDIGNLGMDFAILVMNHVTLVMELGQLIV